MDLKLLLKVSLCVIQLVCLYRVLRHDDYYLAPIQVLITALVVAI